MAATMASSKAKTRAKPAPLLVLPPFRLGPGLGLEVGEEADAEEERTRRTAATSTSSASEGESPAMSPLVVGHGAGPRVGASTASGSLPPRGPPRSPPLALVAGAKPQPQQPRTRSRSRTHSGSSGNGKNASSEDEREPPAPKATLGSLRTARAMDDAEQLSTPEMRDPSPSLASPRRWDSPRASFASKAGGGVPPLVRSGSGGSDDPVTATTTLAPAMTPIPVPVASTTPRRASGGMGAGRFALPTIDESVDYAGSPTFASLADRPMRGLNLPRGVSVRGAALNVGGGDS